MIIMGLDPGSSGGISILETKKNKLPEIIFFMKMPTVSMYGKKLLILLNSKILLQNFK